MQTSQNGSSNAPSATQGAAFFDLDRTLLAGASGPIISDALRRVGLLSGSTSGIESVAFGIFNLIGETWPSMMISRQGARAARGWPIELVQEAADIATAQLLQSVLPFALQEIEEHRAAGRKLVMATTTPARTD